MSKDTQPTPAYSAEHADEVAALNEKLVKAQLPQDPNTETVTLDTPITRGEQTITTLVVRKPKTGTLRGLSLADVMKLEVDVMTKLIPRVVTPTLVEQDVSDLELSDFVKVATAVVGFFQSPAERAKSQQTLTA